MYYCKACDKVDELGIGGHHTRCHPVVHKNPVVVHPKVVHATNARADGAVSGMAALQPQPGNGRGLEGGIRGLSRHGKYADPEKRKTYRKEWMRKKRASNSVDG